ncbi:MAG: SdrD B-like domain-containing protein, partial [Sphingobacteriales bacterium]
YGLYYIPAGNYEFKAAINNKWDENYGLNGQLNGPNIPLNLTNFSRVAFRYNPTTHITTTSIINNSITLAGSFQSELGCSGDWMPDCYFSSLNYNQVVNVWEGTFIIPQGNYEFKVVVDNNWTENYGIGGVLNGPNYPLNISTVSRVNFTYYPASHIVSYVVEPITVVIPGDFQSELGCTPVTYINGDWEPACDFTRLTYDPVQKLFIDTFPIGKGHWEYKVAINNSWYENYGLYGQRDGPNIPLDLPFDCHVIFKYDPISHYVFIDYATSGVCVNKFYDANVNGYMDYGEVPMETVSFTLTGKDITLTQSSGSDGKTCFTNLPVGIYSVKETVPSGYISSTPDSQVVYLGAPANLYFGNVCLGPGGTKGMGFWSDKNGETALNNSGKIEDALWWLRYWSLRNADGTDFDPYTYAQLKTWMQGANAKNMTYMLSAQLATMYLNIEMGYVNYNSIIYTPGCGFTGNGNFMDVYALIWYTNYYLLYKTTSTGKDPDRAYLECLKNGFDNANNNLTFVQPQPCGATIVTVAERRPEVDVKIILPESEARVWPNPSNNYFTIRPANTLKEKLFR